MRLRRHEEHRGRRKRAQARSFDSGLAATATATPRQAVQAHGSQEELACLARSAPRARRRATECTGLGCADRVCVWKDDGSLGRAQRGTGKLQCDSGGLERDHERCALIECGLEVRYVA